MKKLATITLSVGLILAFASCKFSSDYMDTGLLGTANVAGTEMELPTPELEPESVPEPAEPEQMPEPEPVPVVKRVTNLRAAPGQDVNGYSAWNLINNNGADEWTGTVRARFAFNVQNPADVNTIRFVIQKKDNGVWKDYVWENAGKIVASGASGWMRHASLGYLYRLTQLVKGEFKAVVTVNFTDGTSETIEKTFSIK